MMRFPYFESNQISDNGIKEEVCNGRAKNVCQEHRSF